MPTKVCWLLKLDTLNISLFASGCQLVIGSPVLYVACGPFGNPRSNYIAIM